MVCLISALCVSSCLTCCVCGVWVRLMACLCVRARMRVHWSLACLCKCVFVCVFVCSANYCTMQLLMDVFNHAIPRSRFRLLELHLYPIVLLDPRCVSSPSSCWVVLLRFTCFSPRSTLAHIFRMYALIHWSPTFCKIFRHESHSIPGLVPFEKWGRPVYVHL